ncbi:MAG: 4Fe-4S binding protein [Firmicutes bacterium]|nr:4Fe-4S binding protein [Bacillota bacterium]
MKRKIIHIDEAKCNGCGLCVDACHEGALQMVNGKAKLVSESYCDGLGDCLPVCPTGAITIDEREAAPFDEAAVKKRMEEKKASAAPSLPCGCPGSQARSLEKEKAPAPYPRQANTRSELRQWPCQLKLVPVNAPYLNNAHLLVAADCTAYAYAGIHQDFMRNRITLIGCPKLDAVDYADKLTAILENHEIKSITVLRMEVPCCSGIVNAVRNALQKSGKIIPWQVATISLDGNIIEE